MTDPAEGGAIRFEPDDACPLGVLVGVGLQGAMMVVASIVLVLAVTARAGGQDDSYLSWAVFISLIIAGVLTALQASRVGRFGAGHVLIMGPTLHFVAISVQALEAGGPALLASLTVASSLFYLLLALWLPLLRRIITPVVSGTVLILIAVSILPIGLDSIREVPAGSSEAAGPIAAGVTLAALTLLGLRSPRRWQPWTPLIALGAGCVVAALLGIYDAGPLADAAWFGLPGGGLPGLEMPPGLDFWALLPAFMVVTLVGGVKNVGDSVAVQQVSWRRPKVTDFRQVQGSLNTNGLGILTTGLVGVPPTTAYASPSVSLVTLTSVASRRVGYVIGATFALSALFPKFAAVLVSIPNPVMGAYVLTATGAVFVGGIRTLIQGGLDAQKALVAATSFAVGAALANSTIFVDLLGETWGSLLDNGLVMGAVTAVLLTLFIEATSPVRQARLEADLSLAALPEIDEFLRGIAARIGWNEASAQRLCSAGEETLISLVESPDFEPGAEHRRDPDGRESPKGTARLIVIARPSNSAVEMEFLAVSDEENLEDRLAYLSEEAEGAHGLEGGEVSLRLLRHYASSVHHQKYYGLDVVTVQVRGSR